MRYKKYINFKAIFGLVITTLVLLQNPAFAQAEDSTTIGEDTQEVVSSSELQAEADSLGAGAADTTGGAVAAQTPAGTSAAANAVATAEEAKTTIDPQVYKNFFYYVLLFFLVCIVVGIIGKIIQVYELTREMQGKGKRLNWNKFNGALFLISLFLGLYGAYWSYVHHGSIAWRDAASEHGATIDSMFITTTVITTIVFVLTHILLFGFSYVYKSTKKRKAYFYPHNNLIEKVWTIVPAIVLTVLVLFGFFTWRGITNVPEDVAADALQVEVTGEQFAWTIRYAGRDNKIGKRSIKLTTPTNGLGIDFNDKNAWDDILGAEIVLPVGQPVRFTINSKDILHSFYMPDFRVQMNAVPGMATHFQMTPRFTTQEMREKLDNPEFDFVMLCAKICGSGHYNMQKTVKIVSEAEYKEWLATQTYFFNEDAKKEFRERQQADVTNESSKEEGENKQLALN
ncbi:cytochrome c oxidase subunit II [Olivibacter sp. SDN3]|uniref:cytochrome c oxidase subunit II n=1 Tax=Olivibacter sp. SDN3 TaxID=2764720 RepID=UPI0016511AA1|nr:cytochrome c oxidase subunit II [Olivibacter sp. SDN3]QNL51349.1 cytochrome c oxidase subunit II [Olivibacter sp. SDN3]